MTSSTTVRKPLTLYGRSGELAALDSMLSRLRHGCGSTLVLGAAPGLGRTALVRHAVDGYRDGPVLHARAAPAEQPLPYSGLHALLCSAPDPLPPRAADVLRPDLAPTALLGLLHTLGQRRPLLVCVDDAHLWDRASRAALGFAARRLDPGRGVCLLITEGQYPEADDHLGGLERLRLGPLDEQAATALVDRLTDGRTAPAVREELRREAAGNPTILSAAAARLTPDQLAGRAPLPRPLPGTGRIREAYTALLDSLPGDTRLLLLFAAAAQEHEPHGTGADAALLTRAGQAAGLDPGRLEPAERAGAVHDDGARVHFAHPLLRAALLRGVPVARRRAAHLLLAALLDGPHRALPRLVQQACAADGHDPALARALVRAAVAPRPHAERSVALARSALLSADETLRGARLAAAAEQAWHGGDPGRARDLLAQVRAVPAPGHAHYVRGLLALRDGPAADALEALLTASALLAPYDAERAVQALLGALEAAWAMGDVPACLDALRRIPAPQPDPALERYRTGLCAVLGGGPRGEGRDLLRVRPGSETAADPAALLRTAGAALVLGEIDTACRTGARALAAVRVHGPESLLPQALEHLAYAELRAGRHARARAHAEEGLPAAHRLGQRNKAAHLHAVLALAASVEGGAAACAEHAGAAASVSGPHGLAQAATLATWALARADLAEGRSAEAAARLRPLVAPGPLRGHFAARMLLVPCFVEAAALAGRGAGTAAAAAAVEEFARWAAATADPQAPAQLARCRALLAPAHEAAARYQEALGHHAAAGGDFEGARTRLLYGQWLRRQRRTREARGPLRDALVAFERCGARVWAERAAGELRAAGEAVPVEGGPGPLDQLTPQQQRIARCVAQGATNREVASRLSLSPRTVDHHLRNVFALLGVRSRFDLARLLDRASADPAGTEPVPGSGAGAARR
ncbi:LuxR C-terminal-related transcriptional regulator [Streptomyces sp. NPDC058662]|uniref:helix-turn-helix transcriptional regulator n=1 Tax=Streptomyces sp. NPDC058662 TaxID=3346583 RepID=UPI0036566F99